MSSAESSFEKLYLTKIPVEMIKQTQNVQLCKAAPIQEIPIISQLSHTNQQIRKNQLVENRNCLLRAKAQSHLFLRTQSGNRKSLAVRKRRVENANQLYQSEIQPSLQVSKKVKFTRPMTSNAVKKREDVESQEQIGVASSNMDETRNSINSMNLKTISSFKMEVSVK